MFQTRREVTAAYKEIQAALQRFTEAAAKLRESTAACEADEFIGRNSSAVGDATMFLERLKASELGKVPFYVRELDEATKVLTSMHANFSDLETNLRGLVGTADTWLPKIFEMSEAGWDVVELHEAEIKLRALAEEGLRLVERQRLIIAYSKYVDAVQIIDGSADPFACAEAWANAVSYVKESERGEYASDYQRTLDLLDAFREMYGTAFEPWRLLHLRLTRQFTPERYDSQILALSTCIQSGPSAKKAEKALNLVVSCRRAHSQINDLYGDTTFLEGKWFECASRIDEAIQLLQGRMVHLYRSMLHTRRGPQAAALRMLEEIQREIGTLIEQVTTGRVTDEKTTQETIRLLRWRFEVADKRSVLASVWYVWLVTSLVSAVVFVLALLAIGVSTN